MSPAETRKTILRRYILGISSESEQAALDAELARDERVQEELEVTEVDLLDAYAADELQPVERSAVEEVYLATTEGRRRLAFARALRRRAAEARAPRRAAPSWILDAAAVGVVAILGALLTWQNLRLRGDIARLQTVQEEWVREGALLARQAQDSRAEIERLRVELQKAMTSSPVGLLPRAGAAIAHLILRPGLLREGTTTRPSLELTGKDEWVELELKLPRTDHLSYAVVVETPEGRQLWRSGQIAAPPKTGEPSLVVRLPAKSIENGTTVAALLGRTPQGDDEPVADYTFRVRRLP